MLSHIHSAEEINSVMKSKYSFRAIVLTGLVGLLTIFMAACGGTNGTASPAPGGASQKASADKQVFTYPLAGIQDIKTFDPAMVTSETSIDSVNMAFTGLVQLNDKLEIQPQMASSWKQAADGVTW